MTASGPDDASPAQLPPLPTVSADVLLERFLQLVVAAASVDDITVERTGEALELPVLRQDAERVVWAARFDPRHRCSVSLGELPTTGPLLLLQVVDDRPDAAGPGEVSGTDVGRLATPLVAAGFSQERSYGSHGARAGYHFLRPPLQVRVGTVGGTSPALPERITDIRVSSVA